MNKSLVDRWKAVCVDGYDYETGKRKGKQRTNKDNKDKTDSTLNDAVSLRNVNLVSVSCSDLKHALSDKLFKRLRCCIYAQ